MGNVLLEPQLFKKGAVPVTLLCMEPEEFCFEKGNSNSPQGRFLTAEPETGEAITIGYHSTTVQHSGLTLPV